MPKGKVTGAWINSPQADAVAEYYVQGHSVSETAELFGVSKTQVNNLARVRGLTNGRNWREAAEDSNRRRHDDAVSRRNVMEAAKEAERQKKAAERKAQEEERRQKARQEAAVKAWERKWYRLTHPPKEAYAEQHEAFLNRSGICEICGKPYTVREFVKSAGLKKACDSGVCSGECRRIKQNRSVRESRKRRGVRDTHRHRARKLGLAYDPSITLKKLVERDGLKCAICGEECDWNDRSWSKYSGPMYPSIDHIVPMAKGGPHTWENVQVAHIICNSEKSDKLEET